MKILSSKNELRDYTKKDFVTFLAEMIAILSIKEHPHKLVVDELYNIAKDKFKDLSLGEMKLAFRMNMLQELEIFTDHFHQFDIKYFSTVLIYFRKERGKAKHEETKAIELKYKPVLSEAEAEYEWKKTILTQFAKFKETGQFICEFPSFQFSEFEKRGLIKLTDAEKKLIYEDAKKLLVEEKKLRRLNPKTKEELNQLSDFIKRATENSLNSHEQNAIKNAARKLAIRKYYESVSEIRL